MLNKSIISMVHARIVPWADVLELDQLKKWFYSDSQRSRAVDKVKSYQSKGSQFLPHVIDSTCQLTSAVLLDESQSCESTSVRLSYTMALIRFVNGILDPNQKSQFAIPLHTIARNVGLGSWFVEIRHWGTHERELPSLDMLRITTKEALKWLWDHYWNDDELEAEDSSEEESNESAPEETLVGNIKSLLLVWPGVHLDFKYNKNLWYEDGTQLISSSNFNGENETKANNKRKSEDYLSEKINSYIGQWKDIWRSTEDKTLFVETCVLHFHPLLFNMLIQKLVGFDVTLFEYILKQYIEQIRSVDGRYLALRREFENWDILESKLIKKAMKYINTKKLISRWDEWMNLINQYPSYASLIVCQVINGKIDSMNDTNGDWRKKKKKKHLANDELLKNKLRHEYKLLSRAYDKAETKLYDKKYKQPIESAGFKIEGVTEDIVGDLQILKARMNQMKKAKPNPSSEQYSSAIIWEQPDDWKPKPFGII